MTSKELVLAAVRGQKPHRTPWVPFVGVHGANLIGAKADHYLRDASAMVRGLARAKELYRPDGLPLIFDLQVEAEVLGCELRWADEAPPSVVSHPLETRSLEELPTFSTEAGRYPVLAQAARGFRETLGDDLAMYGLVTGPFTLALHLMGNDIFLEMFDDPDRVSQVVAHCAEVGRQAAEFYVRNGADVIAIVDPMTSQISTEAFEQFVTPHVNLVFDRVRELGAASSMFVCGNATRNLDVMARTHCDNISVDENVDLDVLVPIAKERGKSVGGNLLLTRTLLMGTPGDVRADVVRCLDACEGMPHVLAPGCDLPLGTLVDNLSAVAPLLHDAYALELARIEEAGHAADPFDDVALPDYETSPEVIVDVITLNSDTCPPCLYMVQAAERAARDSGVATLVREHRITQREGVGVMTKLGVQNLPTICIDGRAEFVSIIPDLPQLVEAIRARAEAAGKLG